MKRKFWYSLLTVLTITVAIPAYYLFTIFVRLGWYGMARRTERAKSKFRKLFVDRIFEKLEAYDAQKPL